MFLRLNGKWDYMANIHWLSLWFSIALFQKSDRNLSKTLIFFVLSWSNLQSFPYFNPSNLRDRNFTVYLYLNSQLVTSNQKQIISGCYCITAVYCWKPKKVCVQTLVDFFFFLLQLTSLCKHLHVELFWPKPKITWFSLHCV